MDDHDINFLKEKYKLKKPKRRRKLTWGRFFVFLIVLCATIGAVFSYHVTPSSDATNIATRPSLFSTISNLIRSDDRKVDGEEDDRINILLLGVGGEGHDGPQLSDTIIFASFKPSTNSVGMISIPRDMIAQIPGYGWRKVNHANAYGELKEIGYGPQLASEVLEKILGQKIHYYVRVDFDGFAKLINDLGGVDVYVDNSFSDSQFPARGMEYANCQRQDEEQSDQSGIFNTSEFNFGFLNDTTESTTNTDNQTQELSEEPIQLGGIDYSCRFETIVFEKGWQHMDGETALKFVRSRHGTNNESSDFARSARQQKVIMALKDKTMSARTYLNPTKINKVLETLKDNVATNINAWELITLANKFKKMDAQNMTTHVLDASINSPLYSTFLNGAYVLLPKNDDWGLIQTLAENIFEKTQEDAYVKARSEEKPQFVNIEIQNGTSITGLAFSISQLLDNQGFDVKKIGNAQDRSYEHTVIYDMSNGDHPEALKELRDFLSADVTLSATGWLISGDIIPKEIHLSSDDYESLATQEDIDFLVILGDSSANLVRR
ncbi:MAG: LCP family protein [Patescibacteria group bacterium]